jgi:hypothetical protein
MELVSPEFGKDERIDWRQVEAAWGIDFPADYKEFMKHYGTGAFNNSLFVIDSPAVDPAGAEQANRHLKEGLAWLKEHGGPAPYEAYPVRPGLVRWGTSYEGDDAFWLVNGTQPDQWTTVVWSRGYSEWTEYACGMVELLVRFFTNPMGCGVDLSMISSVPGRPIRFVNEGLENLMTDPWPDLMEA